MRRIILVVTVALVMAAMMLVMAMPAFATHECSKDNREGVQNAAQQGEKKGQGSFGLGGSVCYNAGKGNGSEVSPTPDHEDPGNVESTPAESVD